MLVMGEKDSKDKKATEFFEEELTHADVEESAHYTYRDGFRIGFGFFIGLITAIALFVGLVAATSFLLKLFH